MLGIFGELGGPQPDRTICLAQAALLQGVIPMQVSRVPFKAFMADSQVQGWVHHICSTGTGESYPPEYFSPLDISSYLRSGYQ